MHAQLPTTFEGLFFGADSHATPQHVNRTSSIGQDGLSTSVSVAESDKSSVKATEKGIPSAISAVDAGAAHEDGRLTSSDQPTWQPGLLHARPLAGLLALVIVICCILCSLAILIASHGQPTTRWKIQPAVYLAIFAALSNSALVLARRQAVPVSWWYHASRGGTVRSLQRHWEVNESIFRAIWHGRHMSLLHIAAFATAFVIIDGPFLQRASTVVSATVTSNLTMDVILPPELPSGFSGYYYQHIFWNTPESTKVCMDYLKNRDIDLPMPNCKGTCRAKLQAPGLTKWNCNSTMWPISSEMLHSMNATWGPWKAYQTDEDGNRVAMLPAFNIQLINAFNDDRQLVRLQTGRASWFNFVGHYEETQCDYSPAIMEYDVVLKDGAISLADNAAEGRFVRLANNTVPTDTAKVNIKQPDTIDALTYWLMIYTNTNSSVALNSEGGPGSYYSPYTYTYNLETLKNQNFSNGERDLNYYDPTADVLSRYNELMFRSAVAVRHWQNLSALMDEALTASQTVRATQTEDQTVYHSDLRWFAGAATLELMTVLFVLPLFWGYWSLSKPITLSPFQIALAFDSPLFRDVNSAAGARGLVNQVGDVKLRYGTMSNGESDRTRDTEEQQSKSVLSGRLGIGESSEVSPPRKGVRFVA